MEQDRKNKWTLEKIRKGFERFFQEKGRYPTTPEIDEYPHLPSSRQIQRRFKGGVPELRSTLQLNGPHNFTKGTYSSERARIINERAHLIEKEIYDFLINKFGKPFVHREFFFTDDHRMRADFFVYHQDGTFIVDVFFPKDRRNLNGCLNSKLRTYNSISHEFDKIPVIFLMMNQDIGDDVLNQILITKKKPLHSQQCVMSLKQFKGFCKDKKLYTQSRTVIS